MTVNLTDKSASDENKSMMFLMIVNDCEIAKYVNKNGVARLFVDLEYIGKDERQKHLDTWKSRQTNKDVTRIREAVPEAHLLVRVNPLHDDSKAEIEDVLARGANSIMLPMFRTIGELSKLIDIIRGRAEIVPLVETLDALKALPEISAKLPIDRVHIGMNDLHLDMKFDFMFEPLANGHLEDSSLALRENNIPFGIGGIARAGEGTLSPEYLLGEHVRLGSDAAILSRTLHRNITNVEEMKRQMDFEYELQQLQRLYSQFRSADRSTLERNRSETILLVRQAVAAIKKKKAQDID